MKWIAVFFVALVLAGSTRASQAQIGPPLGMHVTPRTELILTATTEGMLLGGLGAAALGASDTRVYVGGVMLGAVAGLGSSFFLSEGHRVTDASSQMLGIGALYGGFGVYTGLAAAGALGHQATWGGLFAGVLGGSLGGLALVPMLDLTGGDAAAAGVGMMLGTLAPLLVTAALGVTNEQPTVYLLPAFIGMTAGIAGGIVANHALDFTRSRWLLLGLSSSVGFLAGGGLALVMNMTDFRIASLMTLGGGLLGLAVGGLITRGYDAETRKAGEAVAAGDWASGRARPVERVQTEPARTTGVSLWAGSF